MQKFGTPVLITKNCNISVLKKLYKSTFSHTTLGSDFVDWTYRPNYLGVKICAGKTLPFNTSSDSLDKLFSMPVIIFTFPQN
jgi:hypothetical protein